MPLTSAGLWWRVVAHFKLTRNHSQFARPTARGTHLESAGRQCREHGEGGGGRGGGGQSECDMAQSHAQTRTGPHNAPPHSHHFPQRTQPPHMQSRTGDSLHRAQGEGRGEGRLGRATAHTDKHNTMALTCGGPGWRVVARYKLNCYHAHFARSTAGCTHNWSPQGDNVARGGSQGDCECDTHTDTGGRNAPPHSRRFPHNT